MGENKLRVAILGGGVGALSAAFALTEIDPPGEKYDITVYQLGWRLGGKIANGRNALYGHRIEEHGLHIWAGFYENAFTIMRRVFKALNRPPGTPLATIADAFERQNQVAFADLDNGQWLPWPFWFQPDPDPSVFPGRDNLWDPVRVMPTLAILVQRVIAYIYYNHDNYAAAWTGDQQAETEGFFAGLVPELRTIFAGISSPAPDGGHPLLATARILGEQLVSDVDETRDHAAAGIVAVLDAYRALAENQFGAGAATTKLRRAFILGNIYCRVTLGILKNDCLKNGLQVIDQFDLRDFLTGDAPLGIAVNNAIINGGYDYLFSYAGGSRARPRLSACTAVQGFFRLISYQGAFFFKATAGMGDTVAAPIYQLLKQRGVAFNFFHQVVKIRPGDDGISVGSIDILKQAALRPGIAEYAPLIPVNGIQCWPSTPLWDQIEKGDALAAAQTNFENCHGPQPPAEPIRLQVGEDFDHVILGISLGALNDICQPIITDATNPRRAQAWADMVNNLSTVRTQAFQIWVDRNVPELGGSFVAPIIGPVLHPGETAHVEAMGPIVTAGEPPFDTYSDMSHLLPAEPWPVGAAPASIAYFCSVMDDGAPNDQPAANDAAKANAVGWMTSWLGALWSNIGNGDDFQWNMLHSPNQKIGAARFDDQYWRANIGPSDRYVLSLPGSLQYRLTPDQSGYANLYLAGDWTKVAEINAGCVEVAAMSGLAAAAALSGKDIPIASFNTLGAQ
jgi:uncharacterized protein with NAD-binding domain and iron-sulfur cluster